ncbi:hypothetical protein BRARA_I02518 [Brassica rapa]|uniref:Uncharacterized protein n=2 Tax=Brassica TaxID=3705 RepID=A0A397XWT0_BRACM|nr:hypothetical protein BRARA_I02518 [Brassica rapa]CAF2043290.1 unnamed protein product [Brassica napus]CAG7862761.1 unnamed protein product [Brassica rapa]
MFMLRENHCFLDSGIASLKPVLPDSHRGFLRRFPGDTERVRTQVRCLWKDRVARNPYQLAVSSLVARSNNYSCFFLDKNHNVLSKPETPIFFLNAIAVQIHRIVFQLL